jgi:hypothetical protein
MGTISKYIHHSYTLLFCFKYDQEAICCRADLRIIYDDFYVYTSVCFW